MDRTTIGPRSRPWRREQAGREYVYKPTRSREQAGKSALRRLVNTFLSGLLEQVVAMHLADPIVKVSAEELERIEELIRQARRQGR